MILTVLVAALAATTIAPSDTTPVAVAIRQIDTFNARDLDGFMALYADDATVTEFPSGKLLWSGKAAIRERYRALMKENLPPIRVEPRVVDGSFVVDLEVWAAKPGERNKATWMYDIRGGLIRRVWMVRM